MRRDTKELLNRIDMESFKYQEFESLSWGVDIWPMFEAIMLDERVVDRHNLQDNLGAALWSLGEPVSAAPPERLAPSAPTASRTASVANRRPDSGGLFSGYSTDGYTIGFSDEKAGAGSDSVRAILGRLVQEVR